MNSTRLGGLAFSAILGLAMAGCAATPVEEAEAGQRLDSNTGTTVTLMPRPVELLIDRATGPKTDPFAYLAPFETNRMGTHEMYLWVSAPQAEVTLGLPQLFCGNDSIQLEPVAGDLKAMGLSDPPYRLPAPWSAQWYFKLSGEVLDCFASAKSLSIVTQGGDALPERFNAEAAALTGLGDFANRVRT